MNSERNEFLLGISTETTDPVVAVLYWPSLPLDAYKGMSRSEISDLYKSVKAPVLQMVRDIPDTVIVNELPGSWNASVSATPAAWVKLLEIIPEGIEIRPNGIVATAVVVRPSDALSPNARGVTPP